jgi:CRP-like cAMP-binding protein
MAIALNERKWGDFNGSSPLIAVYNSFHPLTPEMEALIDAHTFPISFRKNRYIISPIDRNRYLYLILRGVVRGFYKDEGTEITTWISRENEIVGTIRNLWTNEESDEYLQAIEDVDLIAIPHDLTTALYQNFYEANIIGRKIMELHYRAACDRALICQLPTVKSRYRHLLTAFPGMVERVPLKYIASFLGVRIETLSRVRTSEKNT